MFFSKKIYIFASEIINFEKLMSGKKQLQRATRNIRVVATPSRLRDNADGTKTQLYRITPLR